MNTDNFTNAYFKLEGIWYLFSHLLTRRKPLDPNHDAINYQKFILRGTASSVSLLSMIQMRMMTSDQIEEALISNGITKYKLTHPISDPLVVSLRIQTHQYAQALDIFLGVAQCKYEEFILQDFPKVTDPDEVRTCYMLMSTINGMLMEYGRPTSDDIRAKAQHECTPSP